MYDPQYFTPCCTPGGSPTSQQLAIVYLVCAIGALFDPETVMQGNELARLCFQIGRASLALDMKPSLAVIQAIHLMGMYTLSTGQSDAACVVLLSDRCSTRQLQADASHSAVPAEVRHSRRSSTSP
jgi:hypothetical protein